MEKVKERRKIEISWKELEDISLREFLEISTKRIEVVVGGDKKSIIISKKRKD